MFTYIHETDLDVIFFNSFMSLNNTSGQKINTYIC